MANFKAIVDYVATVSVVIEAKDLDEADEIMDEIVYGESAASVLARRSLIKNMRYNPGGFEVFEIEETDEPLTTWMEMRYQ